MLTSNSIQSWIDHIDGGGDDPAATLAAVRARLRAARDIQRLSELSGREGAAPTPLLDGLHRQVRESVRWREALGIPPDQREIVNEAVEGAVPASGEDLIRIAAEKPTLGGTSLPHSSIMDTLTDALLGELELVAEDELARIRERRGRAKPARRPAAPGR